MKIVNLIEDTEGESKLLYEHGLSFYIETKKHKLLMDTGASDAFLENAKKKGIDLSEVDTVFISHGHYDHTGGLISFAKLNSEAKIYINENAVGAFYNLRDGKEKYIGMDKAVKELDNVIFVKGNMRIDEELSLFTNVRGRRLFPKGNLILKRKVGDVFFQDEFDHEQYLVIEDDGEKLLLSGCAHNGILNILDEYSSLYDGEPDRVISGFHTMRKEYTSEDEVLVKEMGKEMVKMKTLFYSGHCTGEVPIEILKGIMKDKLIVIHSGDEITIS